MTSTRREFLAKTSLASVGAVFQGTQNHVWRLPISAVHSRYAATALLPEPMVASGLQALASAAIDVATDAGAEYADVRVAEQHMLELTIQNVETELGSFAVAPYFSYGIRLLVNGAWAFVHGTVPSREALAASARDAVATARGYAKLGARVEFAPASPIKGTWETPIQLDPFTVPLGDQVALMNACANAAARVRNGLASDLTTFRWIRETRVFASSVGTMTSQILRRAEPLVRSGGDVLRNGTTIWIPLLMPASGGYECVTAPGLQDDLKQAAEEAVWMASLPQRTLEVGRYPAVFDASTFGNVLGRTLGVALELDRVLGDDADAAGTSILSPVREMIGTAIASPQLTVTVDRTLPSVTTVKWDDDGVEPQSYTPIAEGYLRTYHTSRQTASLLAVGQPNHSNGCAVAPSAENPVLIRSPHLTVVPATTRTTLEDLCQDVNRGILVRYTQHLAVDHQLSTGSLTWGGAIFEVEQGKVVRRLKGNGLQFQTLRLWKSLLAVGDASTAHPAAYHLWKGQPAIKAWQSSHTPAGLFKEVDVIRTGIKL